MEIKRCSKCKESKALNMFSFNKALRDGLCNQCKACQSANKANKTSELQAKRALQKVEILSGEVFKQVIHEGISYDYKISNLGRLISLKNGGEILLNPSLELGRCGRKGYLGTSLRSPDRKKYLTIRVHRLVALAFLDNPKNFNEVNHIDGDKSNNVVSNLEWCDRTANIRHSFECGLNVPKKGPDHHAFNKGRKVSLNGVVYNSVAECARTCGIPRTSLASELDGRMKTKAGIAYVN